MATNPQKETSAIAASLPPISEQAATGAQNIADAQREQRAAMGGSGDVWVTVPQGGRVNLTQYLDQNYYAEDHTSIFADPSKYMIEPKADHMYVWAAKSDPKTFGKVRSGLYRRVEPEEVREDTDLPIETHTVAGKQYVGVYDVLLFEVGPAAVKRLYKWREMQAVLRTAHNVPFERLKAQIEGETHGAATAEVKIDVE